MAKAIGPRVVIVQDHVNRVVTQIKALAKKQVLIGIPEPKTNRSSQITNAALGYIHEHGSPANNLPARPFLVPGVKKSLPTVEPTLKIAADAALHGNDARVTAALTKAGIDSASQVKLEIETAPFVPLKPSTVANRYKQRGTKKRRQAEDHYLSLIKQGFSPAAAQTATGIQPLINTGALRNSITSVVRTQRK